MTDERRVRLVVLQCFYCSTVFPAIADKNSDGCYGQCPKGCPGRTDEIVPSMVSYPLEQFVEAAFEPKNTRVPPPPPTRPPLKRTAKMKVARG